MQGHARKGSLFSVRRSGPCATVVRGLKLDKQGRSTLMPRNRLNQAPVSRRRRVLCNGPSAPVGSRPPLLRLFSGTRGLFRGRAKQPRTCRMPAQQGPRAARMAMRERPLLSARQARGQRRGRDATALWQWCFFLTRQALGKDGFAAGKLMLIALSHDQAARRAKQGATGSRLGRKGICCAWFRHLWPRCPAANVP